MRLRVFCRETGMAWHGLMVTLLAASFLQSLFLSKKEKKPITFQVLCIRCSTNTASVGYGRSQMSCYPQCPFSDSIILFRFSVPHLKYQTNPILWKIYVHYSPLRLFNIIYYMCVFFFFKFPSLFLIVKKRKGESFLTYLGKLLKQDTPKNSFSIRLQQNESN